MLADLVLYTTTIWVSAWTRLPDCPLSLSQQHTITIQPSTTAPATPDRQMTAYDNRNNQPPFLVAELLPPRCLSIQKRATLHSRLQVIIILYD